MKKKHLNFDVAYTGKEITPCEQVAIIALHKTQIERKLPFYELPKAFCQNEENEAIKPEYVSARSMNNESIKISLA
jgi:hypothetical protein